MAHHRSSSHKQEKDFRGLYIGAAIGVAATQVCNYCLALPQPPPPPPEKTAEALDAEKVQILKERESWQLICFYTGYCGVYVNPEDDINEIDNFTEGRLSTFFDISGGYVGWLFPVPWKNQLLRPDLVHPPLLSKTIVSNIDHDSDGYIIGYIRNFIRTFLDFCGFELDPACDNRNSLLSTSYCKMWKLKLIRGNCDDNKAAIFLQMFQFIACIKRKYEGVKILYSILWCSRSGYFKVNDAQYLARWYVALLNKDPWTEPDYTQVPADLTVQIMIEHCERFILTRPNAPNDLQHSIILEDEKFRPT
jgi:hypothetical protein